MSLPAHPDTISGLAPDARRVLRTEYQAIQVAADRDRLIKDDGEHWVAERNMPGGGYWARNVSPRIRTWAEIQRDTAIAITEYRRVAAMWGVG